MKERPPAFQFYAADWLSDLHVMTMTCEQRGAYIQLLAICWREGYLPNDDDQLVGLTGISSKGGLRVVRERFNQSPTDAGKLVHDRLNQERAKQDEWRQKSVNGGRRSGEARQNKVVSVKGGSTNPQRVVEPSGNSSSSSSSSNKDIDGSLAFETSMDYYHPKRRDYSRYAQERYFQAVGEIRQQFNLSDHEAIGKLDSLIKSIVAKDGAFCPKFITWLDSKPWKGESIARSEKSLTERMAEQGML